MTWQGKRKKHFTDKELIEGCQKNNSSCQELLYKRFFSFAMSISLRYAPSNEEAMEIVNDAFIKVFDSVNHFDLEKPFKSWIAKIVVNTAIDSYRKNLKHKSLLSVDSTWKDVETEDVIEQELSVEDILRLFSELPENYRVTFNLHEIEGYTHEEIGEMLGIAPSSSRANLTRAKKMLKTLYHKQFNTVSKKNEAV